MSKKFDVIIIGGGPAGIVCAVTAKRYYPDKNILVVKDIANGCIPCGIPYMFRSLKNPDENKLGLGSLEENGIGVVTDKAIKIERTSKKVIMESGEEYGFEKLVLALGSIPIRPRIEGVDKKGIYLIYKDMDYLKKVIGELKNAKNLLVLGGGFIGVEFADELSKVKGFNVYLAEVLPNLLAHSFDDEFSLLVEKKLKDSGVTVLTGSKVVAFTGNDRVTGVRFDNGREIGIDGVVLGIGAVSNTSLATEAGLNLKKSKSGIWVDEYMRTCDADIFAVGDCAGKRDFYTRKDVPVMLASTATAEARIAGANLYQLKVVRENKGTIAIYSTYVDGLVLGSAGLTETSAKKESFEIVSGNTECIDKHPSSLPGGNRMKLKLIFSKQSGMIMGGQVAGGISAGEVINIIGMAIQQRVSVTELETLQIATHPCLTAAPTLYPIVLAAQDASKKILERSV